MNEKKTFTKRSYKKRTAEQFQERKENLHCGEKLKSETSAKKAYGKKFRHGKRNTEFAVSGQIRSCF